MYRGSITLNMHVLIHYNDGIANKWYNMLHGGHMNYVWVLLHKWTARYILSVLSKVRSPYISRGIHTQSVYFYALREPTAGCNSTQDCPLRHKCWISQAMYYVWVDVLYNIREARFSCRSWIAVPLGTVPNRHINPQIQYILERHEMHIYVSRQKKVRQVTSRKLLSWMASDLFLHYVYFVVTVTPALV